MVLLFCAYTCLYFAFSILSVTTPAIMRDLKIEEKEFGWIITISRGVRFIPKLLGGFAVDIIGGKRMFVIGELIAGLFTIVFAIPIFNSSLWFLITCVCIQQLGTIWPWPALLKVVSHWIDYKYTGRVMSVMSLSYLFGASIIGLILSGLIKLDLGWRFVWYTSGGLLVLSGLVSFLILKDSPAHLGLSQFEPEINPDNALGAQGSVSGFANIKEFFVHACLPFLKTASFWCLGVWYMSLCFVRYVFMDWFTVYMSEQIHTSDFVSSLSSICFPLFGGVGALVMGYINDRCSTTVRNLFMIAFEALLVLFLLLLCLLNVFVEYPPAGTDRAISYLPVVALSLIGFCTIAPSSVTAAISINFGGRKISAAHSSLLDGMGTVMAMLSGSVGTAFLDKSKQGWTKLFILLTVCSVFIILSNIVLIFVERHERKPKETDTLESSTDIESNVPLETEDSE